MQTGLTDPVPKSKSRQVRHMQEDLVTVARFASSSSVNLYMYYTLVLVPSPCTSRQGCRGTVMADSHVSLTHVYNMAQCDDAEVNPQVSCTQTTSV